MSLCWAYLFGVMVLDIQLKSSFYNLSVVGIWNFPRYLSLLLLLCTHTFSVSHVYSSFYCYPCTSLSSVCSSCLPLWDILSSLFLYCPKLACERVICIFLRYYLSIVSFIFDFIGSKYQNIQLIWLKSLLNFCLGWRKYNKVTALTRNLWFPTLTWTFHTLCWVYHRDRNSLCKFYKVVLIHLTK